MADQTRTTIEEHDGFSAKAQELLARFSSTVFAFDTSGDTRYIRCDFPQCKQHVEALQGKRCWLLNTVRNVKVLERHVGKEVHDYMKERDSRTDDQMVSPHYVESQGLLEKQQLPEGTRKVLAVFNLKDPQSQFGDWMSLFFKAAFMAEGMQQNDCVVITQNFVSRQELMECIAKLKFLNSHWPTVEVVVVLSCHSSCQGQVFSCTPFAIGKQCGFEEFCSLHDFVMACQSALKDMLMATHISSCFTLKLDCSHADWPVDADWLKTRLHSILCGSTKEVYETGSQVADLHLMLSTMIPSITTGTCGTRLRDAVNRACSEGFPDLAREMGLGFLGSDNVDDRLLTEGKEDEVTPPGLVMSSMRVVFLVEDEFPSSTSQESDNSKHSGSYIALADALVANLQMRKASDVKFEFTILRMKHGETSLVQESMRNHLDLLPCDAYKVLFIALGPMFSRPNLELIKLIKQWNNQRTGDICYGIHFQHVTTMQAYVIKNSLTEIQDSEVPRANAETSTCNSHLAVTGLTENDNRNCAASFPVLLYMIHLAVGENGNRLAGKGIPSAVYSKKTVSHGMSSWTLEEVYMETCHVLSGLSRKCGLRLLSLASNPVETTSTTRTYPRGVHATPNKLSKLESAQEDNEVNNAVLSTCGPPSAPHQQPADPSYHFTFPTKECEVTRDGNSLELFHRDDENIDAFTNDKLVTGNEECGSAMCPDRQSSSFSVNIMDASFSEGSRNNQVSGYDCKPLTDNEVSGGTICDGMSLSTINTVMTSASSSVETGNNDLSMLNITSVSPSAAISQFGEVSIPPREVGSTMNVTGYEDGLDEGPDRVTCYKSSSLISGPPPATSSLENDVCLQEHQESTTTLVEDGNVFSELSGHQVTFQGKPSSTINPCLAINSVRNDVGLLDLEECTANLVNDENGVSVLAGHVLFEEKLSSTIDPGLAISSVRNIASLLDLEECTKNLVNDQKNGISVLASHIPYQGKSSSTIDAIKQEIRLLPNEADGLVDEVDRLSEESNFLTSQEKPSSASSPVGEIAISPQEQGSAIKLVDDEDRLDEQENDDMCDERPCSPIPSSAVLSAEQGSTTNLVNEVDGLEKCDHELCHEDPSITTSATVTSASMSSVEGNVMRLAHDEDNPGKRPDHEACHRDQCSTPDTVTDIPAPRGKTKKKAKKNRTNINKKTTVTTSDVKVESPFQTWLQNFTTFCKTQNEVEQKHMETSKSSFEGSNFQGASSNCSRKKGLKKRVREDFLPGNLESYDTSADIKIAVETDCVPSTSVCASMSETIYKDSTLGHIDSSDHEQTEFESDSLNSAESVPNRLDVFEVLEAKEKGIYKDDQSVSENALGSSENRNMEIDSEVAYARKRSLLIDSSGEVEEPSEKKLKNQSDSECKEKIERSLDSNWNKSDDLPLMANVDEVLVHHYILDLSVKFSEKIMKGNIVLFLEPRNEEVTKKQFQMTLDSSLVNIESVSEVALPDDYKVTFRGHKQNNLLTQETSSFGVQNGFLGNILGDKSHTPLPFKGLAYSVYGWCVQIWKPEATGKAWPRCVWIKYHTSPEGTSLTWATDQDGKPSVFSPGAYINNRSLMPCQEPPVAMSTWQASIHVPEGCVVLMSGNEFVGKTTGSDDQVTYHYEMDCPLPCSTLAVAVGWWQCRQSRNAQTKNGSSPDLPVTCRLFAPPSLIDTAANELLGYAPKFLEASCELLGPYPFRRLDMLVLPKCFACMGLKSPNLVFLSQSLLSGDASMRVRLAHEISHAWFGLLVGAKDWSEEWLSEGFATFIEEKIQSKAERWSKDKDRFFREIRQILRHRCLLSEIRECDDSLKCLRPKVVKPASALSTADAVKTRNSSRSETIKPHTVVQFGQICSRKWTQIHYLKGYFLLHRLASMVGLEEFDEFLFNYVQHFKGQLVASEDFFEFFVESFSNVPRETTDKFVREWLERAGMPKSFPKKFDSPDNELVSQVENEFQTWKKQDSVNKRNKTLKVRKRKKPPDSTLEVAEQVVLLLEKLLERDTISHSTLRQLEKCYNLSNGNAEIRHRWCELVVKHNYTPALQEVQRFLVEDQGMGIYLFGELIISQQPKQRALVDEVLKEIGPEMDRCTYRTVKDMLEGND